MRSVLTEGTMFEGDNPEVRNSVEGVGGCRVATLLLNDGSSYWDIGVLLLECNSIVCDLVT